MSENTNTAEVGAAKNMTRTYLRVAIAVLLDGCTPAATVPPAPNTIAESPSADAKIAELEKSILNLSQTVGFLQATVSGLGDQYKSGTFDPTDPAYQRIDAASGVGSFAVSVQDVRAFGDGVRLTLDLGNLTSARFSNVKLTLKYGTRIPQASDPKFSTNYPAWQTGLESKEVTLTETLVPGSWNPVSVTIPSIASDKFGYLEVAIATNTISLAKN